MTRTIAVGIPTEMIEHMFGGTFGRDGLAGRLNQAHPDVRVSLTDSPVDFAAAALEADAVFLGWGPFRLPAAVLQPGSRLRWVHSNPAGISLWLLEALRDRPEIAFTSSKGPMGASMAEHAAAMLLSLARDLPAHQREQSAHYWRGLTEGGAMTLLQGKTAALLGVGAVGGHLARILHAGFGMRVLGMTHTSRDNPHVDRYFTRDELLAVLPEADVVALTLPATAETTHVIDRAALAAMKPGAILVNVARGSLVDEAALVDALREGRLKGAGLDAFEEEPLPADSPLWSLPNLVMTPHRSAITDGVADAIVAFWTDNIRRFAAGQPLQGTVNRTAGY
jgi:D-2-hydroxyacid dehydrogenase (NADP+)